MPDRGWLEAFWSVVSREGGAHAARTARPWRTERQAPASCTPCRPRSGRGSGSPSLKISWVFNAGSVTNSLVTDLG